MTAQELTSDLHHLSTLVSWETYHERFGDYGATAGVPVDAQAFVEHVRTWLDGVAKTTDEGFPDNKLVRIENDEPIITRPPQRTESASGA